jgi:hypothetical protein
LSSLGPLLLFGDLQKKKKNHYSWGGWPVHAGDEYLLYIGEFPKFENYFMMGQSKELIVKNFKK